MLENILIGLIAYFVEVVHIELADKGLEYEKISASFSIDNIENVPDILCELLPLKPYYGENGVVVLVKK